MKKLLILTLFLLAIISGCSTIAVVDTSQPQSEAVDVRGYSSVNTVFSDKQVAERVPFVSVQFQYNVANFDVDTIKIGSASVVSESSEAVLKTGTTINSQAIITSKDSVRYQPGAEAYALFTAAFSSGGVENVNQSVGLFDIGGNGYFLGYENEDFIVGRLVDGERITYNKTTFKDTLDGQGVTTCNLNKSNLLIYKISFGWLGIAPIKYEVFCGNGIGWVNFATIDLTDSQNIPTTNNPVLPITFAIEKGNSAVDVELRTASWNAGVVGFAGQEPILNPSNRYFSESHHKTIASNTLTNIITLNSTETFFNKKNKILSVLNFLSVSVDGTKPVTIQILKNCQLDGTEVWVKENINNSVISYDKTSTTVSNCDNIINFEISKDGSFAQDLSNLFLNLRPGETLTIAAISENSNTVSLSVRWIELF